MTDETLRDEYKQAMRRLATTVAIITSGSGDTVAGIAATAVMSVTADPPTLAVAINRAASIAPVIGDHGSFAVNLLSDRHRDLVAIFGGAKTGRARFDHGDWSFDDARAPLLCDAAASLICTVGGSLEVGTHTVFVGTVGAVVVHPLIDPLLWVDGGLIAPTKSQMAGDDG